MHILDIIRKIIYNSYKRNKIFKRKFINRLNQIDINISIN